VLHIQSGNCSYRQLSFESAAVPFCMVAYKVATARNTLVFTPISTANYTYSGPYGYQGRHRCTVAHATVHVVTMSEPRANLPTALHLQGSWTAGLLQGRLVS
jgi:hypothetical protein